MGAPVNPVNSVSLVGPVDLSTLDYQLKAGVVGITIRVTWTNKKEVVETYLVRFDEDAHGTFFELSKCSESGEVYRLRPAVPRWGCDCPSYTYRCGPKGEECKHVRAVRALLMRHGLLEGKS